MENMSKFPLSILLQCKVQPPKREADRSPCFSWSTGHSSTLWKDEGGCAPSVTFPWACCGLGIS